jgi:large subunit ribosomal protein L16
MKNFNYKVFVRFISSKRHKGRVSKVPVVNVKRVGEIAIISEESGRISAPQIKSIILTLKRKLPSGTSIIPRISAHLAVTKKPLEVRMGKGKGSIAKRIARIRPNTVIIEIAKIREVIPIEQYLDGLKAAASKLPVKSKIHISLNNKEVIHHNLKVADKFNLDQYIIDLEKKLKVKI